MHKLRVENGSSEGGHHGLCHVLE